MRAQSSADALVLIVDPDSEARASYAAGLASSGWITDAVDDGREALAKAISQRPAAIVTETRVPNLDGIALCRLLRADPATCYMPIVVVTGESDECGVAQQAGADAVFIKPCPVDVLARVIRTVLAHPAERRHRHRSPRSPIEDPRSMSRPLRRSKEYQRGATLTPPAMPPTLVCPSCDQRLEYRQSYIGGVSATYKEQWDRYECPARCGSFEYRQRTRSLRRI